MVPQVEVYVTQPLTKTCARGCTRSTGGVAFEHAICTMHIIPIEAVTLLRVNSLAIYLVVASYKDWFPAKAGSWERTESKGLFATPAA